MKQRFIFLMLAVACCFQVRSAAVTVQDAQSVALNYFKVTVHNLNPHQSLSANLTYTKTEADNTIDFYVFNISPGPGFVIVSGDDNVIPVLAYSTESNFNSNFNHVGLNDWVKKVSSIIYHTIQSNILADDRINNLWSAYRQGLVPGSQKTGGIGPLCSTTWDQENDLSSPPPYIYNQYCPFNNTDNQRALTGCVATAMAQIMKYWNYPPHGTLSHSYDDSQASGFTHNYGTQTADFASTNYDWTHMPNALTTGNSSAEQTQDAAVGTLMYQCGVSVEMDYGDDNENGSGAFVLQSEAGGSPSAQSAFATYFGYNANTLQGATESNYTSSAWTNLIEGELNAGRVVQYEGDDNGAGHTWVCDGYDASDNLHMNWGWNGSADGFFVINNLNAGGYNFNQNDAALIGIQPPVGVVVHASAGTPGICPGGSSTLTASGPVVATYSWSPTTGLTCPSCASTPAHPTQTTTYTVTADSAGYTATASATITVHPAVNLSAGTPTGVSCHGGSNGSATVTPSGGTPSFNYTWSNSETSATATNLSAGTYTVTVRDAAGCSATATENINQPNVLSATTTETNASCNTADGSASVTAAGGTSAYTYLWSNSATSSSISNVGAATYTVTVTDHNHCTVSASTVVAGTATFTFTSSSSPAACFGSSNGSATVNVTGGAGITYNWSNNTHGSSINNVPSGTYTVTITDNNGCSATTSQNVSQPNAVTVSITHANAGCGGTASDGHASASVSGGTSGYSYLWSNSGTTAGISNLPAATYTVTVTDAHSCTGSASVVVTNSGSLSVTSQTTNLMCFGINNGSASVNVSGATGNVSYTWSNNATSSSISNLGAGTYTVIITDGSGCSASSSETITQPSPLSLSATSTDATCGLKNGSASVTVTGGTSGYNYAWSSSGATSAALNSLSSGTYTVTVTDNNSCTATAAVMVSQSSSFNTSTSSVPVTCNDGTNGSATVTVSNGTSPYTYTWSNGQSGATCNGLAAGSYSVTITDAQHCSAITNVSVVQPCASVTVTV